jgi:hypothetical protein
MSEQIIIGIIVLGVVTFIGYLFRRFLLNDRPGKRLSQKQKSGDNSTNIQAGRDINTPK